MYLLRVFDLLYRINKKLYLFLSFFINLVIFLHYKINHSNRLLNYVNLRHLYLILSSSGMVYRWVLVVFQWFNRGKVVERIVVGAARDETGCITDALSQCEV